MKKLYKNVFLGLVTIGSIGVSSAQCTWTLDKTDTFGDGWNNNQLSISINGTSTNYTLSTGSSGQDLITVNDDDIVIVEYLGGGSYNSEVGFTLTDQNSNTLTTASSGPNLQIYWQGGVSCANPGCANPTALALVDSTLTTIDLTWQVGSETSWLLNYGVAPSTITGGTALALTTADVTVTGSTATYTLTGLVKNTDYNILVAADCGSSTNSHYDMIMAGTVNPCPEISNITSVWVDNDSIIVDWTVLGTETMWNIELGASGFTPNTGTELYSNALTTHPDTIGGLVELTDYDIYVQADCGADSSSWVGPLTFTTLPNCPNVSGIGGTVINTDSLFISWTSNGPETMWDYEYGPTGFTSGTGTVVADTNTNDTIANLTPGTSYDFYVRSNCGGSDQGVWMGPFTISTPVENDNPCDAIQLTIGTSNSFSNFGSTNTFDPGNSSNKTVWFKFTAPASGRVAIATCGSTYDTELSLFDTLTDCSDILQYTEIGYADYNPYGCAGSHPAGIEVCDLTAGEEYLFKIGAWSSSGPEGTFPLLIWDLEYNAGTDASVDVCLGDTVNLAPTITDSYSVTTTTWSYPANPNALLNDTLALTSNFTIGSNQVMHIASNSCMADTAYVTVNIAQMANSGTAITPFNGCNTGDVYLPNGLTGTVDAGGTWTYDNGSSAGILAGNVFIANGLNLGSYQFTYTADNGACPPASTQITVTLNNCVGIEEDDSSFGIYPNPNNGTFTLESSTSGKTTVDVLDIQGKVVYSTVINITNGTQNSISVSSLEVGTYLLRLTNNNNITVKTLIIK